MDTDWLALVSLYTLGFSTLFPLINPLGTALIINPFFSGSSKAERASHSLTIALFATLMGMASLLLGSWCLKFMGISIFTTQIGGGLVIASMGYKMLNAESSTEDTGTNNKSLKDSLFYPITFPLLVGPGGISALIALSAHAHTGKLSETLIRLSVLSAALLTTIILAYFCIRYAELINRRVGAKGSQVLNRLMAFLVFCIGLQMALTGLSNTYPQLFK